MSESDIFSSSFGELSRIIPYIPEQADLAAGRIFDLHQRHAARSAACSTRRSRHMPRICGSKRYRQAVYSA